MKNLSCWPLLTQSKLLSLIAIFCVLIGYTSCSDEQDPSSSAGDSSRRKTSAFDAPSIACTESTQNSITVTVTAGASGAPAGFSLQWVTKDVLDANGGVWPLDETLFCKAGFSGNAFGHVFNLSAGASTTVTLGDILFDTPGASSSCVDELICGTEYVFRAFAHATSTMFKSDWSVYQTCGTDVCAEDCVSGQGHWKNTSDPWPVESLMLGNTNYIKDQLLSIFNTPPAGNGLISLAHQLIAAKLNVANGAVPTVEIQDAIDDADAMIGDLVVPPVGAGSLTPGSTGALNTVLQAFNDPDEGVSYCN
jgi:hypothetical protein